MAIDSVSQFIVKVDKFLDYIPFLSIVNNTIVLIAKIALALFSFCFRSMYEKIKDNDLIDHVINQKSVLQCICVSIPFLNILVAVCRDYPQAVVEGLQDKPSPLDETLAQAKIEMERNSAEAIRSSQAFRAETKQKMDLHRAEQEKQHNQRLIEYDIEIAACPDTQEGRQHRERLIWGKAQSAELFKSYSAASVDLQQANGF